MVAAAASAKKRIASPVKAKTTAKKTKKVVMDPFEEACSEIFDLLEKDESLNDSARQLLRGALPFALRPAKAERHKFQSTMTATTESSLKKIETAEKQAVNSVAIKLEEAAGEKATIEGKLESAQQETITLRVASSDADVAVTEALSALQAAKSLLADGNEKEGAMQATRTQMVNLQAEREQLVSQTWTALKEGFPAKEWRVRDKKIKEILKVLHELQVEESLTSSLAPSLKAPTGVFAGKCIAVVEERLKESLAAIQSGITSHDVAAGSQVKSLAELQDRLTAANAALEERQSQFIKAENEHLAALEKERGFASDLKALGKDISKLEAQRSSAEQSYADAARVIARFEALVEGGAEAAAAAPVEGECNLQSPRLTSVQLMEVAPSPAAEVAQSEAPAASANREQPVLVVDDIIASSAASAA